MNKIAIHAGSRSFTVHDHRDEPPMADQARRAVVHPAAEVSQMTVEKDPFRGRRGQYRVTVEVAIPVEAMEDDERFLERENGDAGGPGDRLVAEVARKLTGLADPVEVAQSLAKHHVSKVLDIRLALGVEEGRELPVEILRAVQKACPHMGTFRTSEGFLSCCQCGAPVGTASIDGAKLALNAVEAMVKGGRLDTTRCRPIEAHVTQTEAEKRRAPMTRAEAEIEARRRWGNVGFAEIVMATDPSPEASYEAEVGVYEEREGICRRTGRGRGPTWEAAFASADRTQNLRFEIKGTGFDEVTKAFRKIGEAARQASEAVRSPARRVDRTVRALDATVTLLLASEPFGPLGIVARRRLAKVCSGLRDALDHARSRQALDMAVEVLGRLTAVQRDTEPMSEAEELAGVEMMEADLANLVESIKAGR